MNHEPDRGDWQPATSKPGEIFTIEGRIQAVGAFARGMKRDDPRLNAYRRPMLRIGAGLLLAVLAVTVVAITLS